ncbi:MAG TPA: hypothetical protein VJ346_02105 [Bacteroidales bacterium]|nr:hypothetical protein [Bacteroidales bacterium]
MKRLVVLFISGLVFHLAVGQELKQFSEEPDEFISQLEVFMKKNITQADEEILKNFIEIWKVDSLDFMSADEKKELIEIFNILLDYKARTYPHFRDFILCIMSFRSTDTSADKYNTWKKGFISLLNQKRITLSKTGDFLEFTMNFLDSNFIYKSSSTIWKANPPDCRFVNEKDVFLMEYTDADLVCYSKRDSINLFDTRGRYNPVERKWTGDGGLVTWERGGYSRDSVNARLSSYVIDMSKSEYAAENVVFTNKYFFSKPLTGTLTDKVKYIQSTGDATYPQFDSYQKNFYIKDLYDNIDYEGGLSMQGSKLVGTGDQNENAKIFILRNDSLLLLAKSGYFAFRADRINGTNTSVVIHLDRDSIFHPGLDFRYVVPTRQLTLSRSERFTSQSPYFNSYHNIDMSIEQLVWKTDEPLMHFRAPVGATIGNANFESADFFNYNWFNELQGMDEVHPLILIRSFSRKIKSEEFSADEFANYLKMPVHLVKQMLMRMSVAGFVYYDTNTEIATIKPKLHTYIAASVSQIDYDVISFPSRTSAPIENATFDLRTFDLTINGIPQIFVSDSQNVIIIPKRERIVMKKNRDFEFDGTVIAGLFTFDGSNLFFSYDSFKINLQNVDLLQIKYRTGAVDGFGKPEIGSVNNVIQHITGELLVDRPDNKSGRENYPEYPIFKSKENSYVFYERPDIQGGVYNQNEFYFEIYPYTMDSLDNFNKDYMLYDGEFISAGIFPPILQQLSLQNDKSLGFKHSTPEEGIPLYGGKGIFKNEFGISNSGLWGKGIIEYLTSATHSDDIVFYPDSTNAHATSFTIAKTSDGQQFPGVNSRNNYIRWLPYADEFYAYKKDVDFTMFNDSTHLAGSLKLEPTGLSGSGKMDLKNSEIASDLFTYNDDEIFADTSDFYLKSLHTTGFTVLTENVKSHIDYKEQKGYFNSNEDFSLVNFPENRYISYLDYFIWDMNKKEMAMGSRKQQPTAQQATSEDEEPVGPTYISMHPQQDSLNFISPLAYYDYQNNLIKATQVKFIDVADARIYPDEGNLIVEQDARIQPLENARVKANMLTRYHLFHSATINIYGRKSYDGLGNYDYEDENGDIQNIHFKQIQVDENLQTVATGEIYEPDNFKLSPYYSYIGKAYLEADKKFLTFDGALKIEHNCDGIVPKWLDFRCEIDPHNIYIPIPEQPLDINQLKIFAGLFMYYDSVHIYPAFMTPRKNYSDRNIIPASGYLYYDKPSQLYRIASMEKLIDRDLPGNYLSFHREDCELYGEGKLDLGIDLGLVKVRTAGNLRHNIINNTTTFDVFMGLDFFFEEKILNIVAYELDSIPGVPAADLNRTTYNRAIIELAGKSDAQAFKDELNLFGTVRNIPEELRYTLVFNDLKLEWNPETRSYMSVGKIGIGSINNIQINKLVDGLIEIQVKRSGDICDIYLEVDRRWYYFGYTRGVLQVLSSNKEFLDPIIAMKPNERKQKVHGKGSLSYIYMVSTDRKKALFYRRYQDVLEQRRGGSNSNQ